MSNEAYRILSVIGSLVKDGHSNNCLGDIIQLVIDNEAIPDHLGKVLCKLTDSLDTDDDMRQYIKDYHSQI